MVLAGESKLLLYGEQGAKLLPRGVLWTVSPGSVKEALLRAMGSECAHADERVLDYLRESDPRTTDELLTDWERVLGLPGPCAELEPTLIGRRYAVVAKLTSQGGQSIAYYVQVAAALGYSIEIEEFPMAEVGVTVCGDELNGILCRFVWTVHAPPGTPIFFSADESGAGDPLATVDATPLECALQSIKPAHTLLLFEYDLEGGGGYGPWETFNLAPSVLGLVAPPVIVTES